ncbi:MAG: hypothetical protein ABJH96_02850 [Algoriphagus sp.]|uniref:hypothetical protein n=1 Tax=Algoriphagus sp. TaxID=1872435 RepID=UPI003298E4F0
MKKLLFGMAFYMGAMLFTSLDVQALEDECKTTVVTQGELITVTVCGRRTTIWGTIKGDSCTKPSSESCSFTNLGNPPA